MKKGSTKSTKISLIKRNWHLLDIKDKMLGRAASEIAVKLMGKNKPYFVRNLDCGDYVVVINAKSVGISGKKRETKAYRRHSGYPGGFKSESFRELIERKPEDIISHAVKGMLPDNRLQSKMLSRLFVFPGQDHGYKDKFNFQDQVK